MKNFMSPFAATSLSRSMDLQGQTKDLQETSGERKSDLTIDLKTFAPLFTKEQQISYKHSPQLRWKPRKRTIHEMVQVVFEGWSDKKKVFKINARKHS